MQERVRGETANEIAKRRFTAESFLMKRERKRELEKHHDRIQNVKPCVDNKPSFVRHHDSLPIHLNRQPVRSPLDKGKLREIEKQNYRILMKLRDIHKNHSLYTPKKHMYLLKGEACNLRKPGKKPPKFDEPVKNARTIPFDNRVEMVSRVGAMHLR